MRGIECAFFGSLARDVELKTAKSGKPWAQLLVMVDVGEEKSQLVQTAVFGDVAEKLAGTSKGARVYVEGTIKPSQWNSADGEVRHGLSCAAFKCEKVGSSAIGRNRPKTASHREQDEVPGANSRRPPASFCAGRAAPRQHSSKDGFDFDRGDRLPF